MLDDFDEGEKKANKAQIKKKTKSKSSGQSRIKEADHIQISQLPRVNQIKAFKNMMRQEVATCSGRGDAAFTWMRAIENLGSTFYFLANSGKKFESIDCELASALTQACNSTELAQEIMGLTDQEGSEGGTQY